MIEEYAIVIGRLEGSAILEIERRTACGLCGQTRGCGNATWGKLLGHKSQTLTAENSINAEVGESVVVGIDERVFLRSVFYLYIVPLLSMLLLAILVHVLFNNEFYVILAAFSGLIIGFYLVKQHMVRRIGAGRSTQPYAVILRRADDSSACGSGKSAHCISADTSDVNVVKFQTKRGE